MIFLVGEVDAAQKQSKHASFFNPNRIGDKDAARTCPINPPVDANMRTCPSLSMSVQV